MRDIFTNEPVSEFELSPDQFLQLLKPLYGLCESRDLWFRTLDVRHMKDLSMRPLRSDPSLYAGMVNNSLEGLSGTYSEDMLRAGDAYFRASAKSTSKTFGMAEDEQPRCTFTGFRLNPDGYSQQLQLDQDAYVKNLRTLNSCATFSEFTTVRIKLAWLYHSRTDVLQEMARLAQAIFDRFRDENIAIAIRTNRTVTYAHNQRISIKFPILDVQNLTFIGYHSP